MLYNITGQQAKETMETIMLSIGGSVIHPDTGIDTKFLAGFAKLIRQQVAKGRRFFIMVGGGHIGREYQYAARNIRGQISEEDMNWLGVHGTRLNAHLIRAVLADLASKDVVTSASEKAKVDKNAKIVIGAGGKPGHSTDYDLVSFSQVVKARLIICLLNVKMIYDKDPKIFPDASPLSKMSWAEYRWMTGDWWNPERELPFDPAASKVAQRLGLKVIFVEGRNLANLKNLLDGKKFKGTIIQ
jgi:uridylate kinase